MKLATRSLFWTIALGGGLACSSTNTTDGTTGDGGPSQGSLAYYSDPCGSGDPVGCGFKDPVEVPDAKYKKCSDLGIKEGDACTKTSEPCVLTPARKEGDAGAGGCTQSASYLTCLAEKRDAGFGGCPVSTRRAKNNVHYLDSAEKANLATEILELRIASYDYKRPTDGPSPSVGFILEDAPGAPFVIADRSRVDMYSYVSSLVVTVQQQQKQIDELRGEIAKLQAGSAPSSSGAIANRGLRHPPLTAQ
jgi:hypothetical protein